MNLIRVMTDLGSPKESILTCQDIVSYACENKVQNLFLADETMYAVPTMYDLCAKNGIKLIVGTIIYIKDNFDNYLNIVIYALDNIGYQQLCKIATVSQKNTITDSKTKEYHCISLDEINDIIGNNKEHIVVTTGDSNGILLGSININENKKQERNRLDILYTSGIEMLKTVEEQEKIIKELKETEEKLAETINTRYSTQIKLGKISKIEVVKKVEQAKTQRECVRLKLKGKERSYNMYMAKLEEISGYPKCTKQKFKAVIEGFKRQADNISKTIFKNEDLEKHLVTTVTRLTDVFGKRNVYLEIQPYTNQVLTDKLIQLSKNYDLQAIVSNICKMRDKEDILSLKIINSLYDNTWQNPTDVDKELYLKIQNEIRHDLSIEEYIKNTDEIAKRATLTLEKECHYPKYDVSTDFTDETEKLFQEICE